MPYLPPVKVDGPAWPPALSDDLRTEIGLIEERWKCYPEVAYSPLDKRTTAAPTSKSIVGEAGSTKWDPLWQESVPDTTEWVQPHTTAAVDAADTNKYQEARKVRIRIQRTAREDQLKKFGFDRLRYMLATVPTSMLDRMGITCDAGDRFVWNNELFEVMQWSPQGWRYNSTVCLYVVLNVEHARRGS